MCAQRFRKFKLSFSLFASDARHLPKGIHEGLLSEYGVPRSVRFDRIEVSNILDANYVGIKDVLLNWSPLLAKTTTAVITGYFMNWFMIQEDGRATNADKLVAENILKRILDITMVSIPWVKIKCSKAHFVGAVKVKGRLPQSSTPVSWLNI